MCIREIAQASVRYGYRKIRVLLNHEGWDVGKYLVYRLYTEEGLSLKRMKPAGKRKAVRHVRSGSSLPRKIKHGVWISLLINYRTAPGSVR